MEGGDCKTTDAEAHAKARSREGGQGGGLNTEAERRRWGMSQPQRTPGTQKGELVFGARTRIFLDRIHMIDRILGRQGLGRV